MRRWLAASLFAVALLGVACSGEEASPPRTDPTIPTLPPEALTTVAADPYAVPAVIDEAYVNRVLAGLEAAVGDITRLVLRERVITVEVGDRLKAVYASPESLQLALDSYQADHARDFAGYREVPGDLITSVESLISVRGSCIYAAVNRDYSQASLGPGLQEFRKQWVAIVPSPEGRPGFYNRTGWSCIYDGFQPGFVAPEDPCSNR